MGFLGRSAGKWSLCNAGDPGLITGSGRSLGEGIDYPLQYSWPSLVAQTVKNLPAIWDTWVWSLGWEDPLEKRMAAHSNILGWRIPWIEEPGGLQSMGLQRAGHDWETLNILTISTSKLGDKWLCEVVSSQSLEIFQNHLVDRPFIWNFVEKIHVKGSDLDYKYNW